MSTVRSCAGSALALWAAAGFAQACTLPPFATVTIERVGREAVLDDGRSVRLSGVTPIDASAWVQTGPARLSVWAATPDRWGRIAGVLSLAGGGLPDSVNLAALRRGAGFALPSEWPPDCSAEARRAENEARIARRGVWAADPVLQASDVAALGERVGRFAIVSGVVRSVRQGRRQVFLNFGAFGVERFSAAVAVSRLDMFKAAGIDLPSLRGHRVEMRGVVGAGPSMELQAPEALAVLRRP